MVPVLLFYVVMSSRRVLQGLGPLAMLLLACSSQEKKDPPQDAAADRAPSDTVVLTDVAGAPDTHDAGTPIWTTDSRAIDVTCAAFGLGTMRFAATRDQLSPTQLAQLARIALIAPNSSCIADEMTCSVSVTGGDGSLSVHDYRSGNDGCGSPDLLISSSFEPFRGDLPCVYSEAGSPVMPAPAVVLDGRCWNGISLLRSGPLDRALTVADSGGSHHLDLNDCDGVGQAGKVHLQLFAEGGTTALAQAQPVSAPGVDHTCLHLDYTFVAAGTYHVNVVVDPDYQPRLDVYLRFY